MTPLTTTWITTLALMSLLSSPANGGLISTTELDKELTVDDGVWMLDESVNLIESGDELWLSSMPANVELTPLHQETTDLRVWENALWPSPT